MFHQRRIECLACVVGQCGRARGGDGPRSLGLIRRLYWEGLENTYEGQLALEARLQTEAGLSADYAEGVAAFREKRPARFSGR